MKSFLFAIVSCFLAISAKSQDKTSKISLPDPAKKIQVVEASCGECQFQMTGKGCNLAVRIKGKSYFVDGTSIDEHGDAHSSDGFCEAIRKAEVQGKIVNNRFKASYFKLMPPMEGKLQ